MAKYSIEDSTLKGIADAIRAKEGTTDAIPVSDLANRVTALPEGGLETCTVTVTPKYSESSCRYTDGNGEYRWDYFTSKPWTVEVAKNTLFYVSRGMMAPEFTDGIVWISELVSVFYATADGSVWDTD